MQYTRFFFIACPVCLPNVSRTTTAWVPPPHSERHFPLSTNNQEKAPQASLVEAFSQLLFQNASSLCQVDTKLVNTILKSKDSEVGTTNKREHVAFVHLGCFTQQIIFLKISLSHLSLQLNRILLCMCTFFLFIKQQMLPFPGYCEETSNDLRKHVSLQQDTESFGHVLETIQLGQMLDYFQYFEDSPH